MAQNSLGTYSYTLSLTGVPGIGKTAIFNHVKRKTGAVDTYDDFSDDGGIDCCIYSTEIKGTRFKVSLYDTGGMERYASLTSNYFHKSHAVILVYLYSTTRLDTIPRLNSFIDNAKIYNEHPSTLVFVLWGHETEDDSDTPSSVPDLAIRLMEEHDIPQANHCVVSANYDDDRLMKALDDCIWAIHINKRPKADSVLTPDNIKLSDDTLDLLETTEDKLNSGVAVVKQNISKTGGNQRKKCCFKH